MKDGAAERGEQERGDRTGALAEVIARGADRKNEEQVVEADHRVPEAGEQAIERSRGRRAARGVVRVREYWKRCRNHQCCKLSDSHCVSPCPGKLIMLPRAVSFGPKNSIRRIA